jgi:hypothetical protein
MDRRSFERSLRAFQARKPYRDFTTALVNGDRVQVDHPETLVVRGGLAIFVAAGGVPTLFDHRALARSKHKSNGRPDE